jgi:hypothetical protein
MYKATAVATLSILLTGCITGGFGYTPPATRSKPIESTKTIERPLDAVWKDSVAELGKNFFVINNIDKSSGLINVSYSGDPEKYVDCGFITSKVKNARGERNYNFNASKASMEYEVTDGSSLAIIKRSMALEGRVNLIFQSTGKGETTVTANTRYSISRTSSVAPIGGYPRLSNDSVAFNGGQSGVIPNSSGVTCYATGELERSILESIK